MDKQFGLYQSLKVDQRVRSKIKRYGLGNVVEILDVNNTRANTGLQRYGVRMDYNGNVHDFLRHEIVKVGA